MEKTAPTTQTFEDELDTYLGIRINHTSRTHQILRQRTALIETYLSTNAFNILFLTTYAISLALMFLWGAYDQYMLTATSTKRWLMAIARGFGYTLNLNTALVIFLASRLIFTLLRETPLNMVIPFDKTFPNFHIIVGYVIFVSVVGHAIFHMVWIIQWHAWASGLWNINMSVATGFSIATILLVMLVSSVPSVRRNRFSLFYAVHIIGAACFFVILLVHGVYNAVPYTYKWLAGPLFVYVVDRLFRKFKVSTSTVLVGPKNSALKDNHIIKVRIRKQFNFRAGQYAEIKVPVVNKYEWHPFTIASAPFEETMCFYIKSVGDWTTNLRLCLEERLREKNPIPMEVFIRGPFGAPAQHVRGYRRVVLISGGVGATPFASICKDLFHHINTQKTSDHQTHQSVPDSPAMLRAETDIRNCLNEFYQQSVDQFTDEEAFLRERPMVSLQDLFSENKEDNECFSPQSTLDMEPMSQRNYLDHLGLSFDRKRKPSVPGLTPVFLAHETRHALFETPYATSDFGAFRRETTDSCAGNLFTRQAVKLLVFFHSVMLNMLLCIAMLLRISFIACASIFRLTVSPSSRVSTPLAPHVALAGLDFGLGVTVLGILLSSFMTEILVYRMAFFKKKSRVGDVLILFPLASLSILYPLQVVLGGRFMFYLPAWAHLFVILPFLVVTLTSRLYRVIGAKIALADFASKPGLEKLRAVDFIWTVPIEKDDVWLREELEPIAHGSELRLHRFLTRQRKGVSEEKHRWMTTTYGRPDWESVFTRLAERTPSGGKVGVFFCGPRAMSEAIISSLMKVQVLSNLRGTYLGTSSDKTLREELEVESNDIRELRARGCNIRFVFRKRTLANICSYFIGRLANVKIYFWEP